MEWGRTDKNEFDFPLWSGKPKITYTIAATPRSGSTLLSAMLWRSGWFGAPLEYLNRRMAPSLSDCVIEDYWDDVVRRRTSTNGVFGAKVFTQDLSWVLKKYPSFRQAWQPGYIIRLHRKDFAAQAISYYRAMKSQVWFRSRSRENVDYDFEGITRAAMLLAQQEKKWDELLISTNTIPLHVVYEDILIDPKAALTSIADFIGITLSPIDRPAINLPRLQSGTQSLQWRHRFLEDLNGKEQDIGLYLSSDPTEGIVRCGITTTSENLQGKVRI